MLSLTLNRVEYRINTTSLIRVNGSALWGYLQLLQCYRLRLTDWIIDNR